MKKYFFFAIFIFFSLYFDINNIFKFTLLSSLLHEIGHISAYIVLEKRIPKIKISIFGLKMNNDILNVNHLLLILMAGPLINMLCIFICLYMIELSASINLYTFMLVNCIIFIINITPVYFLDGGNILSIIFNKYKEHYKMVSTISMVILSVMALYFTGDEDKTLFALILFWLYFLYNISNDY